MNEVTIVTAFYDIGRLSFKDKPRSNSKYFEYFKFWARIKNNIIIYTTEEFKQRILDIRENFNLLDKTQVIVINKIEEIEPELYLRMNEIENNEYSSNFRYKKNSTSSIAKYDYLMLLKTWFLDNAVKRGLTSNVVAWIDFGFNHGGKVYTNPKDFNFCWKTEIENKIHLFQLTEFDSKPIYEITRSGADYIMGPIIIVPSNLTFEFWTLNKNSMKIMLDFGLIDDDQTLMLMSYRRKPNIFSLKRSSWFLGLKEFGAPNLTIKKAKQVTHLKKFLIKVLLFFLRIIRIFKYFLRTAKNI